MVTESQSLIRLVAAVIERDGRYLITQRRATAVLPGLWEFPGGRVEEGEDDGQALKRELRERLGTDVEVKNRMAHRVHHYQGYSVDLNLYQATISPGQEPSPLRVAEVRWVPSTEFEKYPFPAADQATTDLLLGFRR
jgi:8-oxo-dGTP diphosphatase